MLSKSCTGSNTDLTLFLWIRLIIKKFVQEALKLLTNNDIMKDDGIIIAEHSSSDVLPEICGRYRTVDCREYGDTMITIYSKDGRDDL